jgi:hypothetical protein
MEITPMMRFAPVSKLPTVLTSAGIKPSEMKRVNKPLVDGITAAFADVNARGAAFQRWFGGMAANWGVVQANMQRLRDFANGSATLSLVVKEASDVGAGSNAYVWPQGDRAVTLGSYILNLGSGLGGVYSSVTLTLANNSIWGSASRQSPTN